MSLYEPSTVHGCNCCIHSLCCRPCCFCCYLCRSCFPLSAVLFRAQVGLMMAQRRYGRNFMVPRRFQPPKFDYHRPIPPELAEQVCGCADGWAIDAMAWVSCFSTRDKRVLLWSPWFRRSAAAASTRGRVLAEAARQCRGNSKVVAGPLFVKSPDTFLLSHRTPFC